MAKNFDKEQTRVAFMGTNFSRAFANQFFEHKISGYIAWIQEPEEQSTGGGARARQAIVLRSADARPMIAIGWVNVATKQCLLRSYECVMAMHRQRFPDAAELDEIAYNLFFKAVRPFFEQREMKVEIEERAPDRRPPLSPQAAPPPAPALFKVAAAEPTAGWFAENRTRLLMIGGLLLASLIVVLLFALRR